MTAAGWPGVRRARRAAQWGKKKYAGSLAEDVWRRLDTMDFINRGMVFAATLLLCLFPFLIVVSALAGRPAAQSLTRYTGLNSQAAADIGHLFASSAATTSAVVGTASMVFFVFGGIAAAAALQEIYEQAFDLPHRRIKDLPHRLAWLAVLIGASLLSGWAGPGLRHAGGRRCSQLLAWSGPPAFGGSRCGSCWRAGSPGGPCSPPPAPPACCTWPCRRSSRWSSPPW